MVYKPTVRMVGVAVVCSGFVLAGCTSTAAPAVVPTPVEPPSSSTRASSPPEPSYVVTSGRGDVDGDGRSDLITVRSDDESRPNVSEIQVRFASGRTVQAVVSFPDQRYEGAADLSHTGRDDVLVWSTASGCCQPYPNAYESLVLRWRDGQLRLLERDGQPYEGFAYNGGRGDAFSGWRCTGSRPVITQTDFPIYDRGVVRTTVVAITGWQVHTTTQVEQRRLTPAQAGELATVDCPPLNAVGFDSDLKHVYGADR
jgi:hypothetical protein